MFKLIVAGGRDFSSIKVMTKKLDNLLQNKPEVTIISGGARGADRTGEAYARNKGHKVVIMKADWDKLDKAAGFIRNTEMAKVGDAAACFWDGHSRGTLHMINCIKSAGKPLRTIMYETCYIIPMNEGRGLKELRVSAHRYTHTRFGPRSGIYVSEGIPIENLMFNSDKEAYAAIERYAPQWMS